jgi:hypothetical protein
MKIGVFGDSFANKFSNKTAWWQLLKQYGHDVDSYAIAGSSINFSAKLIHQTHTNFDFIIWCMTTPGRFSIEIPGHDEIFHTNRVLTHTGVKRSDGASNYIDSQIIDACQLYLKYVFDPNFENLIGKALANYLLNIIPNLMIIPCFTPPLETNFNLWELCTKELQQAFPNMEIHKIYESWQDIRVCHLTTKNNQILAEIIASNLKPEIFSTDYSNFSFENMTIDQLVREK